jgi:hypothetical protein
MLIRGWTENAMKSRRKERLEDRTGRKIISSLMADRKGSLSDITNYTIKFNNSENKKKCLMFYVKTVWMYIRSKGYRDFVCRKNIRMREINS